MSGIVKGISKVFRKIVKSKIFRAVLVAAAVYFTGGLALGAMGSATAAALPGISAAAETLGLSAGAFGSTAAASVAGSLGGMTAAEVTAGTAGIAEGEAAGSMFATAPAAGTAAETGLLASAAPTIPSAAAPVAQGLLSGGDALAGTEIANTYAATATPTAFSGAAADVAAKSASWIPKWFSDLPAAAQTVVANAALEGAKGVAGAYVANEAEKDAERKRAAFQNNQQPVSLSWNGPSGFHSQPTPDGSTPPPPATQPPAAVPAPSTAVSQEVGRAATGSMPTAKQRFAPAAPMTADELERQQRLRMFQGGGLLTTARSA